MALVKWNPFGRLGGTESMLTTLQHDMNRLFEDMMRGFELAPFGATATPQRYVPAVDVVEDDTTIRIQCDLPGLDLKDITVSVQEDTLTIAGERKTEREATGGHVFRTERYYGAFERSMALPAEVDPDKCEATFKDGVLNVTLQKTPESRAKAKRIPIKAQ